MLKMSRKLLLGLLVICVLVQAPFIFAAVNPTAKNPLKCRIGSAGPMTVKVGNEEVNEPCWEQMLAFQSAIEKYSQGRVKVELYANGRLGDNKSMLEQVLTGNLCAVDLATATLAPFYSQIQALSIPYLFSDMNTASKVTDGSVVRKLYNDMAAKSGFRVLSTGVVGFTCYANRKKEVRVPADMKGLKMRVPDSPIILEIAKATSATPCPVAWMETYSALQTGVVDGMHHTPATILSMSFQEVLKYLTISHHTCTLNVIVTNEKFFKSLPADLRKVFIKAGREAGIAMNRHTAEIDTLALKALKKSGMQVYEPTPAEMKIWVKTIRKPVAVWFKKNVDSKMVDQLIKDADKKSK
jgi:tripartite ATP-independent transporter DctP family solute receptor